MPSRSIPLLPLAQTLQMNSDELVVPGQRITTVKGTPGTGVFTLPDGNLYASLVGKVTKDQVTGQVTVTPFPQNAHRSVVPQVDQIILGKVKLKYYCIFLWLFGLGDKDYAQVCGCRYQCHRGCGQSHGFPRPPRSIPRYHQVSHPMISIPH